MRLMVLSVQPQQAIRCRPNFPSTGSSESLKSAKRWNMAASSPTPSFEPRKKEKPAGEQTGWVLCGPKNETLRSLRLESRQLVSHSRQLGAAMAILSRTARGPLTRGAVTLCQRMRVSERLVVFFGVEARYPAFLGHRMTLRSEGTVEVLWRNLTGVRTVRPIARLVVGLAERQQA